LARLTNYEASFLQPYVMVSPLSPMLPSACTHTPFVYKDTSLMQCHCVSW